MPFFLRRCRELVSVSFARDWQLEMVLGAISGALIIPGGFGVGEASLTGSQVRLFAAYNVNEPLPYMMAMWTFAIAGMHFGSELLVFRSLQLGRANFSTFIVASGSLAWMWLQGENYLR